MDTVLVELEPSLTGHVALGCRARVVITRSRNARGVPGLRLVAGRSRVISRLPARTAGTTLDLV